MAIPGNHPVLKESFNTVYCSSIGGTPVSTYWRAPFTGRIGTMSVTPHGAITTADCAIAVAINGTTNTNLAGTLPVAGAAAGTAASWVPLIPTYVAEGDVIKFTPSGASGASIAATFGINLLMG
jgi:hypothetical protein